MTHVIPKLGGDCHSLRVDSTGGTADLGEDERKETTFEAEFRLARSKPDHFDQRISNR